jgi:uncharacterized protein YbjT (DUF2867 family)
MKASQLSFRAPVLRRLHKLAVVVLMGCIALSALPAPAGASPQKKAKLILVTGATGTQGGAVARELLDRGYAVRAMTRSPGKPRAQALASAGATLVQADFDDPHSLREAMDGAYGVFAVTKWRGVGVEQEVVHARALVDAAAAAGVRHFVYTSVSGANRNTGVPHFDSKYRVEQYLAASDLTWSVVRPVSFMNNWKWRSQEFLDGRFVDPGPPEQIHQWIAASDIGFFVGEAFDNPDTWAGRAEDIAGDAMTLSEFAALLTKVLERPVRHVQISWADYERASGEELAIMHRWFAEAGYGVDVAALRARYPELISAAEFLRAMDWGE